MNIIIFIFSLIILVYCILILLYNKWFNALDTYKATYTASHIFFTVIIPARNEEQNIGTCLQSIIDNNYDSNFLEIIIIDDFSTDNTLQIVEDYKRKYYFIKAMEMKNLTNDKERINSYKKLAIQKAIEQARGEYIITTDADCIVPKKWLKNYNAYIYEKQSYFVAAPVKFIDKGSFLSKFQCLDFLSLQGITAASVSAGFHSMCNGANLCYKKEIFLEVNGFKGFEHLASGDDMFLMGKIQKKYPQKTHYLFAQNSIVETLPMPTIKTFINQRIRWASKADSYDDKRIVYVLFLVYFTNLLFLILFVLGFFNVQYFLWLGIFFVVKCIFEMIFMHSICKFFDQMYLLKYFPLAEPFHLLYTIVSGWLGKFGKYEWKGRRVK